MYCTGHRSDYISIRFHVHYLRQQSYDNSTAEIIAPLDHPAKCQLSRQDMWLISLSAVLVSMLTFKQILTVYRSNCLQQVSLSFTCTWEFNLAEI